MSDFEITCAAEVELVKDVDQISTFNRLVYQNYI